MSNFQISVGYCQYFKQVHIIGFIRSELEELEELRAEIMKEIMEMEQLLIDRTSSIIKDERFWSHLPDLDVFRQVECSSIVFP